MATRVPVELTRGFFELRQLHSVLHRDTEIALTRLRDAVMDFHANPNQAAAGDSNFWCKAAIRSFMGEVDCIGYVMRSMVLRGADKARLSLTTRERARLMERRYDAATDSIVEERQALLSPTDGLKEGFKYFSRLFGSDYRLDTGGEAFLGFKRIVRVRNNITHPRHPEHLATVNALSVLFPTVDWFYAQLAALFRDIASHTGASIPDRPVGPAWPPFREAQAPWQEFFSEADHQLIKESGSRSLEYVRELFNQMDKDIAKAMALCNGSFDTIKTLRGQEAQFAHRVYLRTLFSDIEAHISAATFQLEAAVVRGKVHLTPEEQSSLSDGEIEDRLASALTLWAREFGNDDVAPRAGESWNALKEARGLRNKITHPRKVEDLEIPLKQAKVILAAHRYLMSNMEALMLDEDKWKDKGGSVWEAIKEEQDAADADEEERDSDGM